MLPPFAPHADQIKATPIKVPESPLQIRFSEIVRDVRSRTKHSEASTATLETLFQTLLHRAFDSSLTAQWREDHAAELLQEMEIQAR